MALEAVSNAKRGGTATLILLGVTFSGNRRHKIRKSPGVELPPVRGKTAGCKGKKKRQNLPGFGRTELAVKGAPVGSRRVDCTGMKGI